MIFENVSKEELEKLNALEQELAKSTTGAVFFRGKHGEVRHEVANAKIVLRHNYELQCHLILNGIIREKEDYLEADRIRYIPKID